jgi:DNA primase
MSLPQKGSIVFNDNYFTFHINMRMSSQQQSREEIVAEVKERADIVHVIGQHVDLKKSGARYLGLCPFHGEKTPSFSVHPGQQFYHCFGCGESGDVFSFLMKFHNMDFPAALKELAGRYNIVLPEAPKRAGDEEQQRRRDQLYAVNEKAAQLYHQYLLTAKAGSAARDYLQQRGVKREIIDRFRIGYAPAVETEGWNFLGAQLGSVGEEVGIGAGLLVAKEKGGTYDRFRDRIVFPITEISGRVCGFGGRIIGEGQPKYLNSPESLIFNKSKLLFGLYPQKEDIRRQNKAVMVEGNFDLISLVGNGLANVVAPLGTALTREQLRLLKRFAGEVTLLFDGDAAGLKAAIRSVPLFLAEQMAGKVAILPEGHDPDTFIRSKGLTAMNDLLTKAKELPEFLFSYWQQQYGLSLDGKSKLVEELRPLAAAAASPLQRAVFIAHFAEKLAMPVEELQRHLDTPPTPRVSLVNNEQRRNTNGKLELVPLTLAQRQLLAFLILQPRFFQQLADAGVRACLAGSIGEIVYLQLQQMLEKNPDIEPEELLTALPEGPEREIVVQLLISARDRQVEVDAVVQQQELVEHLEYLRRVAIQNQASKLLAQMQKAQEAGDMVLLERLMQEKIVLAKQLHGGDLMTGS